MPGRKRDSPAKPPASRAAKPSGSRVAKPSGSRVAKPSGSSRALSARQGAGPKVVVVGGSAGGMESLRFMLRDLPPTFPAPILVVLHLDPTRISNAAELLAGHTTLPVRQAAHGERPRAGTVYLGRPDRHFEIKGGRIALTSTARVNFSRPSVDRLLTSAAKAYGRGTVAIILSGSGFDGREGVQRVKAAGGTCIVEDPATSSQPGMPEAAAATGCVDAVLPADRLGIYLVHVTSGPRIKVTARAWKTAEALLKRKCGVDFQGYRPETMQRRMEARIAATDSRTAAKYVAKLRRDPTELERLRSALLVKVSSFMRDPPMWEVLQSRVLAPLAKREGKREIRMWSAGCATGEEPYTLAMLTLSATRLPITLKVFATDLDEPALVHGREGRYAKHDVDGIPRVLSKRFFQTFGDGKRVGPELRRHVIFGRHDLVRDPPLAGMDVVSCRNVLIYLKPPERREVLDRLTKALRPGGVLFLGKAEGAELPGPGYERVAPGVPIFRRLPGTFEPALAPTRRRRTRPERMGASLRKALPRGPRDSQPFAETQQALNEELQSRNEELETVNEELQSLNDEIHVQGDEARRATMFLGALLDAGPDVVVGCDRQGRVSYWGSPAVKQFGLSAAQAQGKDLLRLVPILDVAALRVVLRKVAKGAEGTRTPRSVKVGPSLRVTVFPALDPDGKSHGALLRVTKADATARNGRPRS